MIQNMVKNFTLMVPKIAAELMAPAPTRRPSRRFIPVSGLEGLEGRVALSDFGMAVSGPTVITSSDAITVTVTNGDVPPPSPTITTPLLGAYDDIPTPTPVSTTPLLGN